MVTLPVRSAPVLAATTSCTVPLPVAAAPADTAIQLTLAVALHAHSPPAVTVTDSVAPPLATDCASGATVAVQSPACVTVNARSAIEMVAARAGPVFAA